MACNCENYQCLETVINLDPCKDEITLKLPANETGTWLYTYEFNGRWFGGSVEVENGVNITLPYTFNEQYVHEIKFYNEAGELFNDTCYTLNTAKIVGSFTMSSTEAQENIFNYEVEENGNVFTIPKISNRIVMFVSDGSQQYNRQPDNFTQSGNTITMTNGNTYGVGQIITITIKH